MATARDFLIFLVLVPALPVIHTKQTFDEFRGEGVFPDDLKWLRSLKRGHFEEKNSSNDVDAKNYQICETPECRRVGDELLSSMNKSVDPCDDFYEFSCGGWTPSNAIPPSMVTWSRHMIFQDAVQHRIKGALEAEPHRSDLLPVRQAKKWYRSCMDTETLERRGIKPIESILMHTGGWPICMDTEEWDAGMNTWQKVEREYARFTGSFAFYRITTSLWYSDKTTKLQIGPPDLPLSNQLPLKYRNYTGSDHEVYVRLVERVVDLFVRHNRADVSRERIRKEAEEMVAFEKEIYKLNDKDHSDPKVITFEELIERHEVNETDATVSAAGIDWKSLIWILNDMVNIEIDPSAEIRLININYFDGIDELLRETSQRTIVNYIHWKFVGDMLAYTTESARNELFALVNEEYGVKERRPRWQECVGEMKMNHAAAYAFVKKFFPKSTKNAALDMVQNIRAELEDRIDKSIWLDAESKELSKDKLNSMGVFIGYPNWYNNRTILLNKYKGLYIGAEYFDNSLSFIRFENLRDLRSYGIDPTLEMEKISEQWWMSPTAVNALYVPQDNNINIPAANFQSPLFTSELPDNVNYGIAGLIVGHEMSHGFDDVGIQIGKDGKKTKLSEDMLKAYYQRAECFLDQFGGYYGETAAPEVEGATSSYDELWKGSRGRQTRKENIADTSGMQAVFRAYKKLDKPGGHRRLPGLEGFTDDQLFFLSFAGMKCKVSTPEYDKKQRESRDPHSSARFRTIGAVSNTEDFAKAFNCPEGSPMNPTNKCDIWKKPGAIPESVPECNRKTNTRWTGEW